MINFEIMSYIFIAVAIVFFIWFIILETRLRRLLKGSDGASLEKSIAKILEEHSTYTQDKKQINELIKNINQRLDTAIQGVGHVRFNPFSGSGDSKPSFAIALINDSGNGVIISTLHVRSSVSLFSKDVVNFKSDSELTEEEQKALDKARDSLHNRQQ